MSGPKPNAVETLSVVTSPPMATPVPENEAELFYESFWSDGAWSGSAPNIDEQMRMDALLRLISQHHLGPRILDVGCGRGVITNALTAYGEVTGIDVVAAAIARGAELFPTLDLQHIDLRDFNAASAGTFDLIVCTEVVEHVEPHEKQAFVSEITRSLRSGGSLLLTTPRGELHDLWRSRIDNDQPTEDWLTEPALDRLLLEAGLTVTHRERTGVYPLSFWQKALVVSPVRRLAARVAPLRRMIDRAGIYQVVLAEKA